jgi:hypothetical protein
VAEATGSGVATGIGVDLGRVLTGAGGSSFCGPLAALREPELSGGAGGMFTFGVSAVEGFGGGVAGVRGGGGGSACWASRVTDARTAPIGRNEESLGMASDAEMARALFAEARTPVQARCKLAVKART